LSEKPGNVGIYWEFECCQGNVRKFTGSEGSVRVKILSRKIVYCKYHSWLRLCRCLVASYMHVYSTVKYDFDNCSIGSSAARPEKV